MCVGKPVERGDLDHRLDLLFEQDRQHDDIGRWRSAHAGRHQDVIPRHVGQPDALLLERALPDQAFARMERGAEIIDLAKAVAGDHAQPRLAGIHHVEHTVMRGHQRRQFRQDQRADRLQIALPLQ